ncbi:TPA_asm: hypothetical protein G4A02_004702 [Salmonella enterica subsp. enterica serovar Typhimurium]|nr:hypothetical protein [Salmonella enterica subsp. enterica serovar Typhimurium]
MGSCAAPSAKGDDKFITTDYLQQCRSSGSRNEKICQFSQARRKSGRAKQNELTATMAHLSPLPLKAFKGPLASFCGRSIIRAKVG